jgi:hypothetical protein
VVNAELTVGQSVLGALALTVVLAGVHLLAPRVRRLPFLSEPATASFAGGVAVAYVFLHLLPEIAAGNERVGRALEDVVEPTPLIELGIFLVAAAGFTVFYGLERLAERSGSPRVPTNPGGGARNGALPEPPGGVFAVHVASFAAYNAVITYTMALRLRTGVAFAVLFTVAMGLHFVLTDRGMSEHYPRRFRGWGRLVLAGALIAGWLAAAVRAPTSTLVVSLLIAALSGSVLLNVFKEELPSDRGSKFRWFLAGLVLYALLLGGVTLLEV